MVETFFKIAYALFVATIVAFGLLLLISSTSIFGSVGIKIVQSGSMEPTIRTGAIVVIDSAPTYKVGDIITFYFSPSDKIPTTHRVIEVGSKDGEARYLTKGDANKNADPREIEKKTVVGKVLFSLPFAGYVLDFAKKPLGFVLIIGLPAGFVIFDEISKIYGEVRKKKDEEKVEDTDTDKGHV